MRNEELLNNLDTLKGIIHKMSTLPEDYDAVQLADEYENAESLILSCRKHLLAVDGCNRIRGYLLASVMTEEPVSLNMREDIARLMVYPEVREQLTASKDENTLWLRQVLTCGRPIAPTFKEFSDVISVIIPELKPCINFEHKSIYHKHNVYEHILAVVDGCKTNDFCVKMAALLHDIGKPHVYTTDETGHRHFHGHADKSVEFAKITLLFCFNLPPEESKLILNLIRYHDMQLASTAKAVRRVKREYGADFIRKWAILRQADRDDHVYPLRCSPKENTVKDGRDTRFYTDIDGILAILALLEYDEAIEARTFKPSDLAINGNDLIQELGFRTGPVIGTILHKLFEEVKADKIKNTKHELLDESLCIFMTFKEAADEQRQPDDIKETLDGLHKEDIQGAVVYNSALDDALEEAKKAVNPNSVDAFIWDKTPDYIEKEHIREIEELER